MIEDTGGIDDAEVLSAALLHDTIEDTSTTAEEIRELFGSRIESIVLEVTDDKRLEKGERKRQQIFKAPGKSAEAKLVKLADKISNVRELGEDPPQDWSLERRQKYFRWASEVVTALGGVNGPLEDLFLATLAEAERKSVATN